MRLRDGKFESPLAAVPTLAEALAMFPSASVLAVDIPIGLPPPFPRLADVAAKEAVGPRRNSVFLTPCREALSADDYASARDIQLEMTGKSFSKQAWELRSRIFEAEMIAKANPHLIEVHPEVSFRVCATKPLEYPKSEWDGFMLRRSLLRGLGITIPDQLGVRSPIPDVLDAAIAAWTAARYAANEAQSFPQVAAAHERSVIWA